MFNIVRMCTDFVFLAKFKLNVSMNSIIVVQHNCMYNIDSILKSSCEYNDNNCINRCAYEAIAFFKVLNPSILSFLVHGGNVPK